MARGVHTENHPAVFPPEFPEFGIKTWSDGGDFVYEPFTGSGTTLIACQNLGRRGRGIEISPAYCAVTLERMATAFEGIEIKKIK
jgi:DNA modification methylase